jgi:hypothetical protein
MQPVVQQVVQERQLAGDEQSEEARHRHQQLAQADRQHRVRTRAQQARADPGAEREPQEERRQHDRVGVGRRAEHEHQEAAPADLVHHRDAARDGVGAHEQRERRG